MSNSLAFLDLKNLSEKHIHKLFDLALDFEKKDYLEVMKKAPAALLFFEPSTRTRASFEMACGRLGITSVVLSGKSGTSLEKGETFEDTVLNLAAMKPSILIVRAADTLPMQELAEKIKIPWINAGWGKRGHPTQTLLDALTIKKFRGQLSQERILFVGDVRHSRVVSSHTELANTMGYKMAFCGPEEFMYDKKSELSQSGPIFSDLSEGLKWATVVMALRVQLERHENQRDHSQYQKNWGLNRENLKNLSANSLIMHPGPVNHGVEIESAVFQDPRCRILDQVTQGVFLRQALVHTLLNQPGDLQ